MIQKYIGILIAINIITQSSLYSSQIFFTIIKIKVKHKATLILYKRLKLKFLLNWISIQTKLKITIFRYVQ